MEYIFIDFENLPLNAIPDHAGIGKVFLFAGERQTKVSIPIALSMKNLGPKSELIQIQGNGNNALDFHIAFYIGKYSCEEPKAVFKIVSKDKGFDPLVKHLGSLGITCARIETLAAKALDNGELAKMIGDFGVHLAGMGEKTRPKKPAKMKAYIKNRFREEDAVVDQVFGELVSRGIIEVDGGKLKFPVAPGA